MPRGSKTDVVLHALDGTVLATGRAGGFHPHLVGTEEAVRRIAVTVTSVLAEAGGPPVERLSAYLANVDLPAQERGVAAAVAGQSLAGTQTVGNDTFRRRAQWLRRAARSRGRVRRRDQLRRPSRGTAAQRHDAPSGLPF